MANSLTVLDAGLQVTAPTMDRLAGSLSMSVGLSVSDVARRAAGEVSEQDLRDVVQEIDNAMTMPPDPEAAKVAARLIAGAWPSARLDDPAVFAVLLQRELSKHPRWALAAAVDDLISSRRFLPSIAEIRETLLEHGASLRLARMIAAEALRISAE